MLIVEIKGGLTSRLDVLSSVVDIPEVQLVWDTQPGMAAKFNELFDNDIYFVDKSKIDFSQYEVMSYGSKITDKNHSPNTMIYSNQLTKTYLYADWWIDINDKFTTRENRNEFLRKLVPTKEISNLVKHYLGRFNNNTYGINIRRGHNTPNYHEVACNHSPDHLFFHKTMEIRLKEEANFFIATDSQYVLDKFKYFFPHDIIYFDKDYPLDNGNSANGVKHALVEWYLLGKTKFIYRTYATGFSMRCCEAFNVPNQELT